VNSFQLSDVWIFLSSRFTLLLLESRLITTAEEFERNTSFVGFRKTANIVTYTDVRLLIQQRSGCKSVTLHFHTGGIKLQHKSPPIIHNNQFVIRRHKHSQLQGAQSSLEANIHLLWHQKVHYRVRMFPPLDLILVS
jgi:hypothetical protein